MLVASAESLGILQIRIHITSDIDKHEPSGNEWASHVQLEPGFGGIEYGKS